MSQTLNITAVEDEILAAQAAIKGATTESLIRQQGVAGVVNNALLEQVQASHAAGNIADDVKSLVSQEQLWQACVQTYSGTGAVPASLVTALQARAEATNAPKAAA